MYNPLEEFRKFKSRMGKPVRPIVEVQKNGSIVNVITNTVQTDNVIMDTYHTEAWEVHPEDKAIAIYIDGVFKGMGFFAGEEGQIITPKKDVELYEEVFDAEGCPVLKDGKPVVRRVFTLSWKGIFGKALDASIIERGSALKVAFGQTLIYCALVLLVGFMAGMSYGH